MTPITAHAASLMRVTPSAFGSLVSSWRTDIGGLVLTGIGALAVFAYLLTFFANRRSKGRAGELGVAAFVLGVVVFLWTCCSGLGTSGDRVPGVVVGDHLALITLVPALLALGAPARNVEDALRRRHLGARPKPRPHERTALFHSAIALALLVAIQYVFLLSPLYGWSIAHQSGGDLVRGSFLLVGCLYWWPIVGTDVWPRPIGGGARMLELAATLPFTAFLGIDFTLTDRRLADSGSLEATHIAGAELWGYPTLFTLASLGAVFWWWMRQEDERAAAHDRELDTIDAAEAIVQRAERRFRNGDDPSQ